MVRQGPPDRREGQRGVRGIECELRRDSVHGACPIVGCFGGKDRNLPGAAQKLDRVLEALGVDHDVKEYPDAVHAFLNDHRGEGPWSVLYVALGHLPVIAGYVGAYHEPSARDARQRILAFFERHLQLTDSAETADTDR